MEPSKEAIEAARDKVDEVILEYCSSHVDENIMKGLQLAYAIDVAPLEKRIAELEAALLALLGNA